MGALERIVDLRDIGQGWKSAMPESPYQIVDHMRADGVLPRRAIRETLYGLLLMRDKRPKSYDFFQFWWDITMHNTIIDHNWLTGSVNRMPTKSRVSE